MKSDFSLGDRVRLSALGAIRCPRLAGRTGTVVGRSIYVNSVAVLLDGNKSPGTIHGAYLEAVPGHVDEQFLTALARQTGAFPPGGPVRLSSLRASRRRCPAAV
jgi:hypothetical protein